MSEENENRKPGHHSQKWYQRHPEAKRPAPATIDKKQSSVSSIWRKCWSWAVVGAADVLLWGGAFTFMTAGFMHLADWFYLSAAILLVVKFLTWEDTRTHKRKFLIRLSFGLLVGCFCIGFVLANHNFTIAGFISWKGKSKDAKFVPPPPGRLIRFDGQVKPTSQECKGLSGQKEIECLCPQQVEYELSALPTPKDNNYSTQVDIKAGTEDMYRVQLFGRTPLYSGKIEASPYGEGKAGITVTEMEFDPYTLVLQSSAPEREFKLEVKSSEGLRLKCINQIN